MTYEDNILYVDIESFQHRLTYYNKTSKLIRVILGRILPDEFEITVESIKLLPDDEQIKLKNYIRNIFI